MKTKFKNNFTTRKQSEKLLELGVPSDSADCFFYMNTNDSDNPHILYKKLSEKQADYDSPLSSIKATLYPCWSVGRLMEIFDICFPQSDTACWPPYYELDTDYITYVVHLYERGIVDLDFSKLEEYL